MENDVKVKIVNGHEDTFPTLLLETWDWCKTQETECGRMEAKVKVDANNLKMETVKGSTKKAVDGNIWIPSHLF